MKIVRLVLFITIISLSACAPAAENAAFDSRQWRDDKGGCAGKRKNLVGDFKEFIKPSLKGKSDREVMAVLGKPDYSELGARGIKYFFYFLEEGPHCNGPAGPGESDCLRIRFEALNRANEIVVLLR